MGSLRVIRAGLFTTVQDAGRWGFQSQGVPVAGAMDPFAHRLANMLVGNPASAATLEITLAGPELLFEDERLIAIAGGEFDLAVDGSTVLEETAFLVRSGSVLRFGERRRGARAYLAVGGGIDVPMVLGSRSTHAPSRMGGVHGRALAAGDVVPLGPPGRAARGHSRRLGQAAGARRRGAAMPLRVLPGPQQNRFVSTALDALQSAPYRVLADSDRMGFRLAGPALRHLADADIISEPAPLGAVQVPASGQPILLMADRQTAGGYAKLATVISADISAAAQLAPGEELSFAVCTEAEAVAALIAQERTLLALEAPR
jgi:antagonist of KipI